MVPRKLWLGNHGSAKNPENVVLETARPTTPTPSMQSFVTPTATVKSGPSIRNLIHDPVPAPAATENTVPPQEPVTPTASSEPAPVASSEAVVTEPSPSTEPLVNNTVADETDSASLGSRNEITEAEVTAVPSEPTVARPPADPDENPEAFQTFWETMADAVFADVPTLHEPIKHYHPVRKGNILIIPVKNDIQENAFAPLKHQVLRYLRDNWDGTLDDIEVKLDISMETKKFILDDNDKLNALREQNPDIADFIKSLNLRIKN